MSAYQLRLSREYGHEQLRQRRRTVPLGQQRELWLAGTGRALQLQRSPSSTITPASTSACRRRWAARRKPAPGRWRPRSNAGSLMGYSPRSTRVSVPHTGMKSSVPEPWRSRPTVVAWLITSMSSGGAGAAPARPIAVTRRDVNRRSSPSSTASAAGGVP